MEDFGEMAEGEEKMSSVKLEKLQKLVELFDVGDNEFMSSIDKQISSTLVSVEKDAEVRKFLS